MAGFTIGVPPRAAAKSKNQKADEPKKEVVPKRDMLTSESVEDINFFKEDLEGLDREVNEADSIYNEIHKLWDNLTGGDYVPRNVRDVAELAKTMVSARTYKAQTINNRIALKKTIVDINHRNNGGDLEGSVEQANATARQIINLIRQETSSLSQPELSTNKPVLDKRTAEGKKRQKEEELLEKEIEARIKSGDIKLGKNDKLVGTNEHVVIRYDDKNEEFVGVDSRTGKIIKDFPKDRLPDTKELTKVNSSSAIMNDGNEIKLFDSLEFDDDYVDEGP